jgi:hypothetical protein
MLSVTELGEKSHEEASGRVPRSAFLHLRQDRLGLRQPEGRVHSLTLQLYKFSSRRSSGKYVR